MSLLRYRRTPSYLPGTYWDTLRVHTSRAYLRRRPGRTPGYIPGAPLDTLRVAISRAHPRRARKMVYYYSLLPWLYRGPSFS